MADHDYDGARNAERPRPPLLDFQVDAINRLRHTYFNRGADYADYEDNSKVAVAIMRALGEDPDRSDDAINSMFYIAGKLSRLAMLNGSKHRDSWLDIAGYALLQVAILDRAKDMAGEVDTGLTKGDGMTTKQAEPEGEGPTYSNKCRPNINDLRKSVGLLPLEEAAGRMLKQASDTADFMRKFATAGDEPMWPKSWTVGDIKFERAGEDSMGRQVYTVVL